MDKKEIFNTIIKEDNVKQEIRKNEAEMISTSPQQFDLVFNSDGKLKKTAPNLINLFRGADEQLRGLFRYNEAINDITVTGRKLSDSYELTSGRLEDTHHSQLWGYISERWGAEYKDNDIHKALVIIALQNKYNPIKESISKALKECDNTKDPFTIIQKYINVEDTEYNRIVLDLAFRGAIARVVDKGVQFDFCLDLVGKQGTGKSTFLREIFKGFYSEVNSYTDKDDLLKMMESWAVNDDELVASNKVSFAELKRIITQRELKVRKPYSKTTETIPIDFIFTRTTNERGHLKDATGDRRFYPIEVLERTEGMRNHISQDDLKDIWGNYYHSYLANKTLYYEPNSKEGKIISLERARYKRQDDIIDKLEWYLSIKIPEDFYSPSVAKHERKMYYYDMENMGLAYRSKYDQENGIEWKGTVERDRMTVSDTISEIFSDERDPKLKNKIRLYMDNLDGWKFKKSIRLGSRVTKGYQMATKYRQKT